MEDEAYGRGMSKVIYILDPWQTKLGIARFQNKIEETKTNSSK